MVAQLEKLPFQLGRYIVTFVFGVVMVVLPSPDGPSVPPSSPPPSGVVPDPLSD
jgi:hypothetical protein